MKRLKPNLKSDKLLQKALLIFKDELNLSRLFLFGSRASGAASKESDYDFVLVTKDKRRPREEKRSKIRSRLADAGITADIFIYTEKLFRDWENEFSSIPETAKNTGIEITL